MAALRFFFLQDRQNSLCRHSRAFYRIKTREKFENLKKDEKQFGEND